MHHAPGRRQHVLLGFILIVLGMLFLLGLLDLIDFGDLIGTWWPLILIAVGMKKMAGRGSDRYTSGLIILALGIFFQLMELDVLGWDFIKYLGPIVLILIGLKLVLFPGGRAGESDRPLDTDTIDAFSSFGGSGQRIVSQTFAGGQATALFGSFTLNLREARLKGGSATISATAIFGSVDILCPDGWKLEIAGSPLFGAVENTCRVTSDNDAPTLVVKGSALFGGIEIKH